MKFQFITSIILCLFVILYYRKPTEVKINDLLLKNTRLQHKHETDVMKHGSPKLSSNTYHDYRMPYKDRSQIGQENATLVMLVRNIELEGALESMRSLEDRFNNQYRYPWVFLNEVPFDDEFIEQTTLMASGQTFYELIPMEDWEPPEFINEIKLQQSLLKADKEQVIYGGMRSYRNMCHFNSGFFFKQKKLLEYDWYFRVEPNVQYLCDFQYDPFKLLRTNNKQYGFVTAIHEYENTIPGLWDTVVKFMDQYPELIHPNNSLDFITSKDIDVNHFRELPPSSSDYNMCHFWSNFEIGNLNFWRSQPYQTYFDFLDRAGGFYYERWGDAPVHSIGLALLMDKNQIHHFEDLGYYHPPYMACPTAQDIIANKRCVCKVREEDKLLTQPYDIQVYSCLSRWWRYGSGKRFLNEIDFTYNH